MLSQHEGPALKPMKRIVVYLATRVASGEAVTAEELENIQDPVIESFGGSMLFPDLHGGRVDEGSKMLPAYRDTIVKIEIKAADNPQLAIAIMRTRRSSGTPDRTRT